MTSTIVLNLILCSAAFVTVAASLAWVILTKQPGKPVRVAKARSDDGLVPAHRRPTTRPQPPYSGPKRRRASLTQ